MSMLAERKRKTKWVVNPTKKPLWTTESTGIKFGKEIMEKMGWFAGKGLGLKEQGIQEPLRVSYKNDTRGIGFKGNDDVWIEQQDEFNSLLSQLSNNNDMSSTGFLENNKTEVKSLEDKSKNSKARVHYQKFTRGKDLSRYTENDLACILGVNKSKKQNSKSDELTKLQVHENAGKQYETSFGVTTVNSGSIQDYFKKKWTSGETKSTSILEPVIKAEENQSEKFLDISEAASDETEVKQEKFKKKKLKLTYNESEYFDKRDTENDSNYYQGGNKNEESRHIKKKHNSKQKTELSGTLQNNEYELTKEVTEDKSEKKDNTKGEKSFEEEIKTKTKKKKSYKDEAVEENQTQSSELNAKSQCLPSDETLIHLEAEDKKSKKEKYKLMAVTEKMYPVENKNSEENANVISEDKKSKKKNSTSNPKTRTLEVKEINERVDFVTNTISEENKKNEEKKKVDLIEKKLKFERKGKTYSDEGHFICEGQMINFCEKESTQNINCEDCTCKVQDECNVKSDSNEKKKSKKRKHISGAEAEEILEFPHNDEDIKSELKEKKSKKRKHNFDSDVNAEQGLESAINDKENIKSESKEEKKKKKRKNDCHSEVETNKTLHLFSKDEHNVLNVIDKSDSKEKKESKKKRHNSHSKVEVEGLEFTNSDENIKSESKEEEKSKKKRHNFNSEVGTKETLKGVTSNDEEIRSESKKDKKKKKRKSNSDSEVVFKDKNADPDEAHYLDQQKKKGKRRRDYSNDCDLMSMSERNFLDTDADYKHLESLENHTHSSTKKERKEKKELEITGNESNENDERKIKKQKRNSLKCTKDKHAGECGEEAKDSVSNNSPAVTYIDTNEGEVSEERNSIKKKKKKKEKENKEGENRKDEIKKEISHIRHTDEVAKAKKQKFENEEKAKAENESAENDTSEEKLKGSESGDKNESANTKIKEVVAVKNEKENQSSELYKPNTYTPEKVLELIRWADLKEFRGSNLGNILGYGFKKQFMNKVR